MAVRLFEISSGLDTGKNSARHLKAAFLNDSVETARLFDGGNEELMVG
jgi:hypothetical protein